MVSLSFSELTDPLAQLQASGKVLCKKLPPQPQPLLLVFPQIPTTHLLLATEMLSCFSGRCFAMLRSTASQPITLSICSVCVTFAHSGPVWMVHVRR